MSATRWLMNRLARLITRTFVPRDVAEPFVGDLLEEASLRSRVASEGTGAARRVWWLAWQIARSLPVLIVFRLARVRGARSASSDRRDPMKRVTTPRRLVLASAAVGTGAIAVGALSFGALTTAALRRGARRSVATPAAAFSGSSAPSAPQVRPQPPPAPPLAMVLVLDRSGSMTATDTEPRGQQTRMALAIEGARRALRTVTLGDLVGVISFDYDARWVADVRHIRGVSDIQDVDQRLDLIRADGGTDIYRALELAYRGLQQVYAKAKHVILLTDGEQGSPAPFPTLVGAMQRAGISVSTIGISSTGSAASTLRNIAGLGQGRFHVVRSAAELPDVVAGEAHTFVSLARPETVYPS